METAYLIPILVTIITYLFYRRKTYWTRRGVPSYGNVVTGIFTTTFRAKENLAEALKRIYLRTTHEKFIGTFMFGQPLLVINDPEIIKQVFLTEYPNFASHGIFYNTHNDVITAHLFNLQGKEWKAVRSKMSPLFSSGKIKSMFDIILNKVQHIEKKIDETKSNTIVYSDYMRRLSIDIICASFLGIEANCIDNDDSKFKEISFILNMPVYSQLLNFVLFTHFHKLMRILSSTNIVKFMPKQADDFMVGLAKDLVQVRSKDNNERNDFVDLLVRITHSSDKDKKDYSNAYLLETAAAQVFVLFAAGFETTSQANTFSVYEMAKQPEILKKVQAECDQVLKESGGKITFETLAKMEYTEKIIKETLRLYPALHFLIRSAINPCKLPTTNLDLEKDTNIWIPLMGLHRDPRYFPNPDKFDPERFSPENMESIPPYIYMPFGEGPRTCIGMRFALVSIKTTILTVLSKYDVSLVDETPMKVEFEPCVYFPVPQTPIPLKLTPRNAVN